MTLETLLQRMISAPIASFKLEAPTEIKPGETADLALFDLEHQKTISVENFKSKGKNTPFIGWQVYGNTLATWVDGQLVYQSF